MQTLSNNLVPMPTEFDPLYFAITQAYQFLSHQSYYADYPSEQARSEFAKALPYLAQYQDFSPHCKRAVEFIQACEERWKTIEDRRAARIAATREKRREISSRYNDLFMAIGRRDGFCCTECEAVTDLQIDHIHPISKGGTNDLDNLQLLCAPCNARKGNKVGHE